MSKHLHIHVHDSAYNYNGTFNKKDVVQNNKKHYYVTYNGIHKLTTTTKVPDAASCGCGNAGDAGFAHALATAASRAKRFVNWLEPEEQNQ